MRIKLAALMLIAGAQLSAAQSMSPMRATVESYTDEFALKVYPRNVYNHPIDIEVRLYDLDDRPIRGLVWPQTFRAASGQVRPVTVLIPFEGQDQRTVRICAESVPLHQQQPLKARICGRYLARHLR